MTQEKYNALNDEERELVDEIGIDEVDDNVEFIRCSRCGRLMIAETEEHYTHLGCLCDECYGDFVRLKERAKTMTDEQIKQNAEAYADDNYPSGDKLEMLRAEFAYLAGAHSRDEEIESLQNQIAYLSQRGQMLFDREVELIAENDKLRNPWICVKERLPEKIKNKGVSKYVFVIWPDGTRGEAYYNYEEYKAPRWEIKGAGITKPAYWMSIPETPKGDKK